MQCVCRDLALLFGSLAWIILSLSTTAANLKEENPQLCQICENRRQAHSWDYL